jgi:hypothetical protein
MNTDKHGWPQAPARSEQPVEHADSTPCRRLDVPLVAARFVASLLTAIKEAVEIIRVHLCLSVVNFHE